MDERVMFIAECLRGELPMTAVCERYGISRKTGYKWLGRYRSDPLSGLADRSRAPRRPPHGLQDEVADAIVGLRLRHPHWGPKKLRAKLRSERPAMAWPAASTIGDLLHREGLSQPRRRRRRGEPAVLGGDSAE